MEVIGRVESACSTVLTLRIKVGVGYDGIIEAELTFEVCCRGDLLRSVRFIRV